MLPLSLPLLLLLLLLLVCAVVSHVVIAAVGIRVPVRGRKGSTCSYHILKCLAYNTVQHDNWLGADKQRHECACVCVCVSVLCMCERVFFVCVCVLAIMCLYAFERHNVN